jgi:hypothetical protein
VLISGVPCLPRLLSVLARKKRGVHAVEFAKPEPCGGQSIIATRYRNPPHQVSSDICAPDLVGPVNPVPQQIGPDLYAVGACWCWVLVNRNQTHNAHQTADTMTAIVLLHVPEPFWRDRFKTGVFKKLLISDPRQTVVLSTA